MTKVQKGWLILTTIAIMLLGWRSHLVHKLLIEQHEITQDLLGIVNFHSGSLGAIGDLTDRNHNLAICNSLALRLAAADLSGVDQAGVNAYFRGCMAQ